MNDTSNRLVLQVHHTAFEFLLFMQRKAMFLDYQPSHQAAVAFIFAIKLSSIKESELIGLKILEFKKFAQEEL